MLVEAGEIERWAPARVAAPVSVSTMGRLWSSEQRQLLRPWRNADGYSVIELADSLHYLHRLVVEAHRGPIPAGRQVRHLDSDPSNNVLTNLRVGTARENALDAVLAGRHHCATKTSCWRGHRYLPDNLIVTPQGWRLCQTCRREGWRQANRRRRARRAD